MSTVRDIQRTVRLRAMTLVAGALTVLAIAVHVAGGPATLRNERAGKPVLPDFAAQRGDASAIRVTLADESYTLARGPDGWQVDGAGGYAVRADRLADLSAGLEALTWDEPRTRDPNKLNRVGLGDPRRGGTGALVEVLGASGEPVASLITGRKGDHLYARHPDETQAFRVSGDLPPLYNRQAWLDLAILDIHSDAVSAVRIFDSRGDSLYLQRTVGASERAFRPAPPYQDYRLVSRITASSHALALTRFQPIGVKPERALVSRPLARHITQTHDGLEIEVKAFREADGFFVTLRAIEAGEGAQRGETINSRAAGWAFELTEFDWKDFTPQVSAIVRPPSLESGPT